MTTKWIFTAFILVFSTTAFARQPVKTVDTDPQFCQQIRDEALVNCQDLYRARAHVRACVYDTVAENVSHYNAETADLAGGGQLKCAAE